MSTHEQDQPIMDGAGEATADEKRDGLAEQVASDHGDDGSDEMHDDLRKRTADSGLAREGDGADIAATEAISTGRQADDPRPADRSGR